MGATISGDDGESGTGATGTLRRALPPPSPRYYRKSGTAYGRFNPPSVLAVVASIVMLYIAFSGGWIFSSVPGSAAYMLLVLLPFAARMELQRVLHMSLDAEKRVVRMSYGIGISRTTLPLRNVVGFVALGDSGGEDGKRMIYIQVRLGSGGKEHVPMGKHGRNNMLALFRETSAIVGRELPVTVAGGKQRDD